MPMHPLLQHTLSTQWLDWHSPSMVHDAPNALSSDPLLEEAPLDEEAAEADEEADAPALPDVFELAEVLPTVDVADKDDDAAELPLLRVPPDALDVDADDEALEAEELFAPWDAEDPLPDDDVDPCALLDANDCEESAPPPDEVAPCTGATQRPSTHAWSPMQSESWLHLAAGHSTQPAPHHATSHVMTHILRAMTPCWPAQSLLSNHHS